MSVETIRLAVITTLTPLIDKYPILLNLLNKSKNSSNDWDFFMTAGGVGMYLLINKVSENEKNKIINQVKKIDKQLVDAIDNLFIFIKTRKDVNIETQKLIGFWILWNIVGTPPTQEESRELAPAIGTCLQNIINHSD